MYGLKQLQQLENEEHAHFGESQTEQKRGERLLVAKMYFSVDYVSYSECPIVEGMAMFTSF